MSAPRYCGWIAVKHHSNVYGEWCIAPKDYFDKHGRIPDTHANRKIEGMEEVMDHCYRVKGYGDGRYELTRAGYEILENPVWYFQRPGYKPPVCL